MRPGRAGRVENDLRGREELVHLRIVGGELDDVLARVPRAGDAGAQDVAARWHDADHARTQVAEHARGPSRRLGTQIDDAQTGQQPLRHRHPLRIN